VIKNPDEAAYAGGRVAAAWKRMKITRSGERKFQGPTPEGIHVQEHAINFTEAMSYRLSA